MRQDIAWEVYCTTSDEIVARSLSSSSDGQVPFRGTWYAENFVRKARAGLPTIPKLSKPRG